jgi:hypothetical protein
MAHASFPALGPVSGSDFRLLAIATPARAPGFAIDESAGWAAAIERLGSDVGLDAVLVDGDIAPASPAEIAAVAERVALVVVVVEPDAEHARAGCAAAPTTSSAATSWPARRGGAESGSPSNAGAGASCAAATIRPIPAPACRIASSSSSI